jgi:hypothetical protein
MIYVPNATGGNAWDGLTNNPLPPGRFITIWEGFQPDDGRLDVVAYQNGENGWPESAEGYSVFYRGDNNGAPFTTAGNDLPQSWQANVAFCPGDGSLPSDGTDGFSDVGSPLVLPTDPDECAPQPCATCLGDLDGDNKVDGKDINEFVDLLINADYPLNGCADFNEDRDPLDYMPDLPYFVDALLFGTTDCAGFMTERTFVIDIDLDGTPVDNVDVELSFRLCVDGPCDNLTSEGFNMCYAETSVTAATTAADLAEILVLGPDQVTGGDNEGLEVVCFDDGAVVTVDGSTITATFTRYAGSEIPCAFVRDAENDPVPPPPYYFYRLGGPDDCVVTNVADGTPGNESSAQVSGFKFTMTKHP